jgi:hypothetical protein
MTRRNPKNKPLRVPDAIAARLLEAQPRIREVSEQARDWGFIKRALNLAAAYVFTPVPLTQRELAFWDIESDDEQEDFLSGILLSSAPLRSDDPDWKHYPPPYRFLLAVLRFEQHRQFDGWTAVTNEGVEQMAFIVAAYRSLGLKDEAEALRESTTILAALPEGEDESELPDAIEAAYERRKNATPTIEARMAVVLAYVRANPGKFAAPA